MVELTHSDKIMAEKAVCVLLVRGESPEAGSIYAYVAVRADKMEDFMKAQQSGTFYPEDYGTVVESGEGEPSDDVKAKMESEYGFNHDAMVDLPDTEKAMNVTVQMLHEDK